MNSLVVMGVAGSGKSSLARAIAGATGLPLVEGDDFHSESSRARMRAALPLTDADRDGWLDALAGELARHPQGVVLACSALARRYRERLRAASPGLRFVFLDLDEATAYDRVASRGAAHLFPPALVADQFATLESPMAEAGVLRLDATRPLEALRDETLCWWGGTPSLQDRGA